MNFSDIQFVVPSYRRAETCYRKTLRALRDVGVARDQVTVFVASEEERQAYVAAGVESLCGSLVVGVPGIARQRAFYHLWFPKGTPLVCADDDLSFVGDSSGPPWKATPESFVPSVRAAFAFFRKSPVRLGGISPSSNRLSARNQATVGLRYIINALHFCFAGDPIFAKPIEMDEFGSGEDYVTSIRAFERDGGVLRLNWLFPATNYFAAGGIDAHMAANGRARDEAHARAMAAVAKQWPNLVAKVSDKKLSFIGSTAQHWTREAFLAEFDGGERPFPAP